MLYELLVGYTPFSGAGAYEVLKRHLELAPIPPSERASDRAVDPLLEEASLRALAKSPRDRFASATEFANFLAGDGSTEAADESILCTSCGTTSPASFKFCPECGQARQAPSKEILLSLEDTGHEEIWADEQPTEELSQSELPSQLSPVGALAHERDTAELAGAAASHGSLLPLPLLGRDRELATVVQFLSEGRLGAMQLSGAQASGTSRLLREACEAAARDAGTLVYLTSPDPSGQQSAFFPVQAMVAAILQLPASCEYEDIAHHIEDLGLTDRDLPGIAELFGYESKGLSSLEAPIRRRELFASTLRILRAAGRRYSAVLAFEDYHLYDQPTKDLLRQLADSNNRSPVLRILVTTREGERLDWPKVRPVELLPLGNEELRGLVAHFSTLGHPDLVTVDELRSLTSAQPGHIEQLIRYGIEGGDISSAPESLADLVAARLDLLPPAARRVLQGIAVFGTEAQRQHLAAVLGATVTPVELSAGLRLLEARDLIRDHGSHLAFEQSIIRDVAYESTPRDVRRSLHEATGDVLSASVANPAVIGTHAELAGASDRAAELLSRAGAIAVQHLDDLGATSLYNRALDAVRKQLLADPHDEQACRLFASVSVKLADTLRVAGEMGLARGILAEAKQYCEDSHSLLVKLLRAESQVVASAGNTELAIELCQQLIGMAIPMLDVSTLCDAYLDLATFLLRVGRSDDAMRELEEGIDVITLGEGPEATSAPERFWRLLLRLAQLHFAAGHLPKAVGLARLALKNALVAGSAAGPGRARATLAAIYDALGERENADNFRRRAIEDMRAMGDRRATAELLLAASRPSTTVHRIAPAAIREARLLAEEVGWNEGVRRARQVTQGDG
jgi:serine/threonine-protein kinase